ncbi:hypothetical protein cypCar_00004301 [Cyprinus carpio]|nr:hypothetical protein cypCar_00004301 [Cyprinus carpio]
MVKSAENINCSEPTTDGLITALKENIFGKTEIRPVINLKTPTNISVNFILYGILDVWGSGDENHHSGTDDHWEASRARDYSEARGAGDHQDEAVEPVELRNTTEEMETTTVWNIEGLSWDPVKCGTDRISIPRKQLWRPDIIINEFSCNLDIYTFPFDIQNCTFTFNSYQHTDAFFSLCLALMVASLLETILIINIQCGSTHYGPLPSWAKALFLNYIAKLVRLSKKPSDQNCDPEEHRLETKRCDPAVETPPSEAAYKTPALLELKEISYELLSIRQQIDKHFKTDESAEEWMHLGQVIDRLLFCLYVVFLSVSFITILVFWIYWFSVTRTGMAEQKLGFEASVTPFLLLFLRFVFGRVIVTAGKGAKHVPFIQILLTRRLLMKSAWTINCSEPTTDALLSALKDSIIDKTDVRPVIYPKTPTNISVSFTLYGILGVDEKAQIFNSFIWVYLFWNIEGLSWDPVECGTDRISLPRKKLWMPDIVINEFMDENKCPDTYYLYVKNTGEVMDDLPIHVISSCNMDIYTFPFDIQNCTFTFNSYKLTGKLG